MIEDPWIILRVDRTRLGAGIWAVRAPKAEGLPARKTRDVDRAWRFKTRRRANNARAKLTWGKIPGAHPSHKALNEPTVGFVVVRLDKADLPRPRTEVRPAAQLALPCFSQEDLDRWQA